MTGAGSTRGNCESGLKKQSLSSWSKEKNNLAKLFKTKKKVILESHMYGKSHCPLQPNHSTTLPLVGLSFQLFTSKNNVNLTSLHSKWHWLTEIVPSKTSRQEYSCQPVPLAMQIGQVKVDL